MKRTYTSIVVMLIVLTMQAQQKRDKENHNAYIEAVDEYLPAPGQFINAMPEYEEGDNATTMAQKCTTILVANSTGDDDNSGLICLGAYGGYITFHFDHSVANIEGQHDLKLVGNAFARTTDNLDGSSEPAVIMVSKDVNHNWLPDDPWYELAGSADVDSVGKVIYDYEITYTQAPMQNIPWTDNKGGSGTISRNTFHAQEYYPAWISDTQLTFRGTLLPKSGMKVATGYTQVFYRSGYVDNRPDDITFDISHAVDADRQPVNLDFIDFVRIYNATNQGYPMIGETSTELRLAEDNHLTASLEAIKKATGISTISASVPSATPTRYYSLDGRSLSTPRRGLSIVRLTDGSFRKVATRGVK